MKAVRVRYYDGKISRAYDAYLSATGEGGFILKSAQHERRYDGEDYEFLPSVGKAPAVLTLSDGGRIELLDEMPSWLTLKNKPLFDKISIMEGSLRWVAISVVVACSFVFVSLKFGMPMMAHYVAQKLPEDTLMEIGNHAEEQVMKMTQSSTLPEARQNEIVALYQKLGGNPQAKIIVRGGGAIGANALAIPNNTIIITDELIKLSDDDNEILAVLAHEQGHLVHRHSLEQAISNLGVGVLIVVITGDTSNLLLALPTLLAHTHYSQKAELEADKFAIDELKRLGISPKYLASFFEKMQKLDGNQSHWSLLSTHPDTTKRIEQVNRHSH